MALGAMGISPPKAAVEVLYKPEIFAGLEIFKYSAKPPVQRNICILPFSPSGGLEKVALFELLPSKASA